MPHTLAETYRNNAHESHLITTWRLWREGIEPLDYARFISKERHAGSVTAYSPHNAPELVYSPEYSAAISNALGRIIGESGLQFGPLMLARQEELEERKTRITAYVTQLALTNIIDIFPNEARTQLDYFRNELRAEVNNPEEARIRIRIVRSTKITPEAAHFLHESPAATDVPYAVLLGRILTRTKLETSPRATSQIYQTFNAAIPPNALDARESLHFLEE